MVFWQYDQGTPVEPDELEEHQGRFDRSSVRCRNSYYIVLRKSLAYLIIRCFDAQRTGSAGLADKDKRGFSPYKKKFPAFRELMLPEHNKTGPPGMNLVPISGIVLHSASNDSPFRGPAPDIVQKS